MLCLHGVAILHYKTEIHILLNSFKHKDVCRYMFSVFPRQLKLECRRTDTVMLNSLIIMMSYDAEHVSIAQHCSSDATHHCVELLFRSDAVVAV